ncbi:unnamed protein product [Timema podura]|uniref:MADF domain-containing protein n=1 Tax=Timema podura TaxID=61482 RepID=A0ABN7P300_TIMPD|nr:unnamed protein product [Timema podura]
MPLLVKTAIMVTRHVRRRHTRLSLLAPLSLPLTPSLTNKLKLSYGRTTAAVCRSRAVRTFPRKLLSRRRMKNNDQMNPEKLISCVFVRPELWDQKNKLYSTREAKLIAWAEVGDEMGVSGDAAKIKWTSLRDVFRREIKRTLRTSIGHDGISQVRSKWVHFNSMLFLKDQMCIDTQSGANFSQNYIDGDTIKVEDADSVSNFPDGGSLSYVDVGDLGAMTSTSPSYPIQPPKRRKRRLTENEPEGDNSETGKQREWFSNGGQVVEDEDYHFLMSVLPSVRQVAPGRKTSFRMKVLELIREEESFVLSKRTSSDEYRGGSDDKSSTVMGSSIGRDALLKSD